MTRQRTHCALLLSQDSAMLWEFFETAFYFNFNAWRDISCHNAASTLKCLISMHLYGTYSSTGIQRKLRHDFALQRSNDMIMLMYADIMPLACAELSTNQGAHTSHAHCLRFYWAYLRLSDWIGVWIMGLFMNTLFLNMIEGLFVFSLFNLINLFFSQTIFHSPSCNGLYMQKWMHWKRK